MFANALTILGLNVAVAALVSDQLPAAGEPWTFRSWSLLALLAIFFVLSVWWMVMYFLRQRGTNPGNTPKGAPRAEGNAEDKTN